MTRIYAYVNRNQEIFREFSESNQGIRVLSSLCKSTYVRIATKKSVARFHRTMARFNETIDTTPQAIREFAAALRLVAASFEKQAETMDDFGLKTIAATHWKSAKRGVEGFTAFAGAIQDAILSTKLQPPLDAMPISVEQSQAIMREAEKTSRQKPGTKKKTKS